MSEQAGVTPLDADALAALRNQVERHGLRLGADGHLARRLLATLDQRDERIAAQEQLAVAQLRRIAELERERDAYNAEAERHAGKRMESRSLAPHVEEDESE